MRSFIAINLASELRAAIHRVAEPLRDVAGGGVTWVAAPALHVTMKFLADQPDDVIARVVGSLASTARNRPPLQLTLGGIGAFPSLARPRVLWLGVAANTSLAALYQDVESACADAGIARETRSFHPHVTLGRVRQHARLDGRSLARAAAAIDFRAVSLAETVDVMESVLGAGGSRYRVVSAVPLAASREEP